MNNILKNLFTIKPSKPPINREQTIDSMDDFNNFQFTYFERGEKDSKDAGGSSAALEPCLDHIFQQFKDKCERDDIQQERDKQPYRHELAKLQTELSKKETLKILKKGKIDEIDIEIKKINDDIADAPSHPEQHGIDSNRKPKAQFYFGLFLLIILLVYILVFYASASFSAFFKIFESTELGAAIFDANAIKKAWAAGWLEGVFIITIPFVFMGLGYLVHMFNKEGKQGRIKVVGLFVITFIFDCILAYEIEKKIYNIEKTLNSPDFNFPIAFQTTEFWGIIFAGFLVYVIWGLVFDFVMKEHENIDKVRQFIKALKAKKETLLLEKKESQNQIDSIELEISSLLGEIKASEAKINGFMFPTKRYMIFHTEYMRGWIMFIAGKLALSQEIKDALMSECKSVADIHCKKHDIVNVNATIYQNTV